MSRRVYRIEDAGYDEATRRHWTQVAPYSSFRLGDMTDSFVDYSNLNDAAAGEMALPIEDVEEFVQNNQDYDKDVISALKQDIRAAKDAKSDVINYYCW